jgi:hypothetical protein
VGMLGQEKAKPYLFFSTGSMGKKKHFYCCNELLNFEYHKVQLKVIMEKRCEPQQSVVVFNCGKENSVIMSFYTCNVECDHLCCCFFIRVNKQVNPSDIDRLAFQYMKLNVGI